MPALRLAPTPESTRLAVTVWRDGVMARIADAGADHWISHYLGMAARFVHMDADAARRVDPAYSRAEDQVSFADGFPLLLISQASLDGLNTRLDSAVTMNRFRPNLVVGGTDAHAEDDWRRIRVGEVEFDVVKRCARCVLTTVDPDTGRFDPQGEPLRTLIGYRRTEKGVVFGQNLIPRGTGRIRQGDTVEVIA